MRCKFLILILLVCGNEVKAQTFSFDSLKVYSVPFNTESVVSLNMYYLIANGDSVISYEKNTMQKTYNELLSFKQKTTKEALRKVRRDYKVDGLNVRALFIFYSKSHRIFIGVSPQLLMFVDGLVYRQKDKDFKDIAKMIKGLYENLYPKVNLSMSNR